ncbi:MAG: NAD-dependent epimerase/dehydratase family protein [Bacteroidota bacterium]
MAKKVLVLGASGQIGTDLTLNLREKLGAENVIASDIKEPQVSLGDGPFMLLNALDREGMQKFLKNHQIDEVYNMVAMLSATAEKHPWKAWDLNMNSLFNTLELQKEGLFSKLFWPSSIAVFGPGLKNNTAIQNSVAEPKTVYGISKLSGERWCEYYAKQYNCDVRSIRYPGIISYQTEPGGGTTDYAVDIFHKAIANVPYKCFLDEKRTLPMMYMADAVKATMNIMEANSESIRIRSSYNIAALSFSPQELYTSICKYFPGFEIQYEPDKRDLYAQSWPAYINDDQAKMDWNWEAEFNLDKLVENMFHNLKSLIHQ